jgi:phage portal protein BeeE
MQTEKQTSWGTGVAEQNRGLGRFTLLGWTMRFEQRLSRLLGGQSRTPRFAEFDFAGLERPTPEEEIRLLIEQVTAGLLTVNEARRIRNLPPIDGGDVLRGASADTRQLKEALS